MKNNKELDIKRLLDADESASLVANDLVAEEEFRRLRKTKLIKLGTAAFLSAMVLIFMTIAWFSSNKFISATNGNVRVGEQPYELMVQGSAGHLDSYLPSGTDGYAKISNELTSGLLTTAGGQQKIEWLVTDTNNVNNYDIGLTEAQIDERIGIKPGSHGVLHFWIVPNGQQSTMSFQFNMKITPFKKQYPIVNGNPNYDGDPTPVELSDSPIDSAIAGYVDSHILFFRYHGDNPDDVGNTKYSKLLDDSITETVNFTDSDDDGTLDPYEIKIYWIWPETLGEAVLTDSSTRVAVCDTKTIISGEGESSVTTYTNEILTKLNDNPSAFLNGYSFPSGVTALTQVDIANDYSNLSIRYNNADQEIGDNIMYLLAELTVDLSGQGG